MPPKKRSQPFEWDEEKKRVVLQCLTRARELHTLKKDITKELRKQFFNVHPECKLAAATLYNLASAAEAGQQLPGETESRVLRWTTEKDAFLIECVTRALIEDRHSLELGLQAGRIGCQGQFRKFVLQFFEEKYPEHHTSTAVFMRISRLRQEKRIECVNVDNSTSDLRQLAKGDNVETFTSDLRHLAKGDGVNTCTADLRHLTKGDGVNTCTADLRQLAKGDGVNTCTADQRQLAKGDGVNTCTADQRQLAKGDGVNTCTADQRQLAKGDGVNTCTADQRQLAKGDGVQINTVNSQLHVQNNSVVTITPMPHFNVYHNTMKYWEFGFRFSLGSLFIGACAKCSIILVDERRNQRMKLLLDQPKVFAFYEAQDIALKVIDPKTNKCFSCNLCVKRNLLNKYRLAPDTIKHLPLPKVISDLSDDDKRQICLVALKSNTTKASSEALRIFKHQKDKSPLNTASGNTTTVATALRWLRKNNHLYTRFSANYETLLRFVKRQPGQPLTVPVLSDIDFDPVSIDQTKTSVLDGEQSALIIPASNVPSRGVNVGNTVAATQHVRSLKAAKDAHVQLLNVFIKDRYLEAKIFPWLFPYGIGGWCNTDSCGLTRGAYIRWRLCMCDSRFRDDADYIFYMLDVIIKERLQYYSSIKVNVAKLAEPLTTEKLMAAERSTNPYDRYGTEVPASIPNSRNYWASKTLDLIAMSEYMGRVPDLFVTLTENDSWPELQAVIRDGLAGVHVAPESKEFEDVHKRGLPAMKFPVQTVIAFYRRLREFRIRFLQDPKGPFGHVQDYWIRIEYQKRGSLHAHLVLWSKAGTVPDDIVSAEMPRYVDHPMNNKWRFIVGNYQKHDCFQQRCFTGKRGAMLSSCKYGFPYAMNDTMGPERSGVRYRYVRRSLEDCRIIPYSLPLLLFWDGHVNVQKVTNGGWELYLAKYVAKSEYPIRMRIAHKRQSNCETYLRSRIVSLLEASTLLLQYPHVFSSREVVYLPIDVNPDYRFLKRMSDRPAQTTVVDDNELYYDTKLEKYLDRPNELSKLTYPQFFARYRYLCHFALENEELDDGCNEYNVDSTGNGNVMAADIMSKARTFRDKKGRQVRERVHHEAIVRFKEYSPYGDDLEKYCLTKLLQVVPVNRESLTALKDNTGSYLEECMRRNLIEEEDEAKQFLEGAAKRGISLAHLRDMATRLIDGNWLQDQDIDQLLETVAPYQMQAKRVRNESVDDDDDNIVIDERDALDLNIRTYLPVAEYISGFTESQRAAFEFVTGTWLKGEQCLAFITGGGGVGKSYLLDSLVAFSNENHKTVQKLATTGCAAHLIGGLTIHSFLRMTPDMESHIERGTTDSFLINGLNTLLIDEVSMLEERIMMKLEECMTIHSYGPSPANNSSQSRFAGKSIIMFGDPAQLPPVGKHIWQHELLKGFHMVVLKERVRQKDDRKFIDLLNRVRLGQPNDADIELLRMRVVTNAQLQQIEIGDRGLMLFPTRRQKNEMNASELAKLSVTARDYPAEGVDGCGKPLPKSAREYIAYLEEKNQLLPAVLTLKIGARVMLVRNRDVEHGWVNGALATVVGMSDDYVVIAAVNNPQRRLITFRVRQEIRGTVENKQYFRRQFPLDLAYSVTIHKSQGQTLDVVAVSASGLGFSGQFYTAISRVRELDGLYLMHFDADAIYLAPDIRKLIDWMSVVDVTRPQSANTIKPRMPEVAQFTSRPNWKVTAPSVTTTSPVIQTVANNTSIKRIPPIQTPPVHHGKRVCSSATVSQVLESIKRLNTNCPLERYLESLFYIINDHCYQDFNEHWTGRIVRENGCVFDETSPNHTVARELSNQTYAAFAKQYGRVINTSGDDSCMYHALSLCLFGHEHFHLELRLMCCIAFWEHSDYYGTEHAHRQLDYDSVQKLIQQTASIHGQESWGGMAHLKAMAVIAGREIYVYTCFATISRGGVHPQCLADQNLPIAELQRKCDSRELIGTYFTRYMPDTIPESPKRPLTVLLSGSGSAAHFSAILPIAENVPLVRPFVVLPAVEEEPIEPLLIARMDISDD